jgi:tetratricopeptide (TPR) repeat protein
MYNVFISYKVEDAAHVRAVVYQLILTGLKVWFDEDINLPSNDKQLVDELKNAIIHSEYAIIFVSPGYGGSRYCMAEKEFIYKCLTKDNIIELILYDYVTCSALGVQYINASNLNKISREVGVRMRCRIDEVLVEEEDEYIFTKEWLGHPYHINVTGWDVTPNESQLIRRVGGVDVVMSLNMQEFNKEKMIDDFRKRKQNYRIYQKKIKSQYIKMLKIISATHISDQMIMVGDFIQYAFTYLSSSGKYERLYQVLMPFPGRPGISLFTFIFTVDGKEITLLRASRYMDKVVASFRWPADLSDRANELTNHAYTLVENNNYEVAIELLNEAIKLNNQKGDAYNELAFIYAKYLDDMDMACNFALLAKAAEPDKPKFSSNYFSFELEKLKRQRNTSMRRIEISRLIEKINDSDAFYPSIHATKAQALALRGDEEDAWMAEIIKMRLAYEKANEWGSGIVFDKKTTPEEIERMARNLTEYCYSLQQQLIRHPP